MNFGLTPEQVKELTEAAVRGATEPLTSTFADLSKRLGVTEDATKTLLRIVGEQDVPLERLSETLNRVANDYKRLQGQAAALNPDNPAARDLITQAKAAIDAGQFERAHQLLREATQAQLAAAQAARKLREQAQTAEDAQMLGAASVTAVDAGVALTEGKYRQAAELFGQAVEYVPPKHPDERDGYLLGQAEALHRQGDERGDNDALRRSIEIFHLVLEALTRERAPLKWAATQHNLGIALQILGAREASTTWLEEAARAFRNALRETPRERAPFEWAMTQICLGNTFVAIGELSDDTIKLKEAVAAFRASLEEIPREQVPLEWAMTQSNLGNALVALGEREGGTARLKEAVIAYSNALEEIARERIPFEWERIQSNLGCALADLGWQEAGTATLERAVVVCRDVLKTRSHEQRPLEWARTQHNLGNALLALGGREASTTRLEEAVAAYSEALQERTYERVPLEWATTQSNLSYALLALGRREAGVARLKEAVAACEAVLTVGASFLHPKWVERVRSARDAAEAEIARRSAK